MSTAIGSFSTKYWIRLDEICPVALAETRCRTRTMYLSESEAQLIDRKGRFQWKRDYFARKDGVKVTKSAEQALLERLDDRAADEEDETSIRISSKTARRLDEFRRKKAGKNGRAHLESRGQVAELFILSSLERMVKEKAARDAAKAKQPSGAGTDGSKV